MSKRVWKLQDFVAHSGRVHCARLGEKSGQVLATGGEDKRVNIWKVGKPHAMMSLAGHNSAVECLVFDKQEEVLVVGCGGGSMQVWNLEYRKMAGTLTGHRTACHSVEFHPYGEFFASGSADTNLKVWDLRRKSCIQTYKGHTASITSIRFSPHGRWVATGGQDNQVKLWDLTAGKLMRDLDLHRGPITSLAFHPKEYLLATGSADRTMKIFSLEHFGAIASTELGSSPVQAVKFHVEEGTVLCASQDTLRVFPNDGLSVPLDAIDVDWKGLQDMRLCLPEEKLIAISTDVSQLGIWVADLQKRDGNPGSGVRGVGYSRLHGRQPGAATVASPGEKQPPPARAVAQPQGAGPRRSESAKCATDSDGDRPTTAAEAAGRGRSERRRPLDDDEEEERGRSGFDNGRGSPGWGLERDQVQPPPPTGPGSPGGPASPDLGIDGGPGAVTSRAATPAAAAPSAVTSRARPRWSSRPAAEPTSPGSSGTDAGDPGSSAARDSRSGGSTGGSQQLPPSFDRSCDDLTRPRTSTSPVSAAAPAAVAAGGGTPAAAAALSQERGGALPPTSPGSPPPPSRSPPAQRGGAAVQDAGAEQVSQLSAQHPQMRGVLQRRLAQVRRLKELWARGDLNNFGSGLQMPQDHAVVCDFARAVMRQRLDSVLNLDACQLLLPVVRDLMSSKFEEFIVTALEFAEILLRNFGDVVAETRSSCSRIPERQLDLAREARLRKCNSCYENFRDIQKMPLLLEGRYASRFGGLRSDLQQFLHRC